MNNQSVSILLSAFNEEGVIEDRVRNLANQDIDFSLIEVLIGSDGSIDKTNDILLRLKDEFKWLRVFLYEKQRGKAIVLNELENKAKNNILIFTDANTVFEPDAINKLGGAFSDETIGGVSGRLILADQSTSKSKGIEEKRYWEYETFVKNAEGHCGILIGANGGIFAIKRELFIKIPDKAVTDDLFITLSVLSQDRKFIYEYDAIGREKVAPDLKSEFLRKIRFAATNFQTLALFKGLLLSKNFLLSFAFWSHKIIRWFVPVILIILFVMNIILLQSAILYEYTFIFQILFYAFGVLGILFSNLNMSNRFISVFSYFLLTNIALFLGLIKYLRGKHSAVWDSTPR